MSKFYQDLGRAVGQAAERYYPEFLIPEAQLMFDTTVISVTTRVATDVTALMIEDKKTMRFLVATECVLGGVAEIMAYKRYCEAKSARRQYQPPKQDKYKDAQDVNYEEV